MSGYANITIERGLPLPPRRRGRSIGFTEHLAKFKVGDSGFFPEEERRSSKRFVETMSARATNAGRKLGRKFTCRTVTEGDIKGVRVWRTE